MDWDIVPSFKSGVTNSSSDRSVRSSKTGSTSLKSSNSERKKKEKRSVRSTSNEIGKTDHNRLNAARRFQSRSHRFTKTGSTSFKSSNSERKRKERNDDDSDFDFVHKKSFAPKLLQTRVASKLTNLIGKKQSQTYMLAPCSYDSDELGVQENEFGDKLEVLAPITHKHFRSYIKLPLGSLKESKNKSQVAKHLQKYVWHFSKENKELLETVHIEEYMNSLGYTEDSFNFHEKYGNNFKDVLYRCHIVSLELVHNVPLIHTVRPGSRNCGWFNRLADKDKDEVNKNLHLLKPSRVSKKGTQSLLSRSAESKTKSNVPSPPASEVAKKPACPIPWTEVGKIQRWKEECAKKKDELKQQGATVEPSPKPSSKTKKKSVSSDKVIVLGHSINLQVLRPDNWKDSVQHHVQVNDIYLNEMSLPDNYNSHCYLACLNEKKVAALKKSVAFLKEEKSKCKKVIDDDKYDDGWDDGPYEDHRFGSITYCDTDGESVCSYQVSGVTRTSVTEYNLCFFMENLIHTNMVWDLGCQIQAFCRDKKKSGSSFFKTCYCPFGFHNKRWRKETGLQDSLVEPNDIEKCEKHVFKNPFDFWSHCKAKSNDCILHHCMLKYLELQYDDVCTKNTRYNVKVSDVLLFSLKLFSVDR